MSTKRIALLEIILFFSVLIFMPVTSVNLFASNLNSNPQIRSSYVVHGVIKITNNGNFTDYGFSGNGLINDPYIIKNYNITNDMGTGILINGTTAFFVITDCYILARTAIKLENVATSTATIINNTLRGHHGGGVGLTESDNVNIINNTIHHSFTGIWADESANVKIIHNNCSFNGEGIELHYSDSSYIVNNTINNNVEEGIYISYSDSATIINNTIEDNVEEGIYSRGSQYHTIHNNTFSNSIYGIDSTAGGSTITYNKFYYHVNGLSYGGTCTVTDNIFIGNDYGIMGLTVYSSLIQNNYCANNTVGIYVEWANYGTLQDNICEYNSLYGIWVKDSLPPVVFRNTCNNNGYMGIRIDNASEGTDGVDVLDNDCTDNGYLGIAVSNSEKATIDDNTCTNDGLAIFDGSVEDYLSYTILNNIVNGQPYGVYKNMNNTVFLASPHAQLLFINCHNLTIQDQILHDVGLELHLAFCYNVTVVDNIFENSDYYGLYLTGSINCTITQNDFVNIHCGAYITGSHNATLHDNDCSNADYGFYLHRSQYSNITSNTFTNSGIFIYETTVADYLTHIIENNYVNTKPLGFITEATSSIPSIDYGQLILVDCSSLDVEGLTLSNTAVGLLLIHCTNINVKNNVLNNNYYGIYLTYTSSSTIQENTISYNTKNGIYLIWSSSNDFRYNEIRESYEYGIYIDIVSNTNMISCNNFYDNNLAKVITTHLSQAYDYQITNYWEDYAASTGNYWSEGNVYGVYVIDGPEVGEDRYDDFPLDNPIYPPVVEEFKYELSFILVLLISSLVAIPILRKKKKNIL